MKFNFKAYEQLYPRAEKPVTEKPVVDPEDVMTAVVDKPEAPVPEEDEDGTPGLDESDIK